MILIIGRSNNETDWSYFLRFIIVDNFRFIVAFKSKRPFGLHTLSFHNLLNAAFWIKNPSLDTLEPYNLLLEFLCFSLIYPKEAILLAYFYSVIFLSYSPFLLYNSIFILNTTKNI